MSIRIKDVCNARFFRSHGKSPQGAGRWGFIFSAPNGPNSHGEVCWFVPVNMKFADARREAVREANRRGNVDCVEVAP
jgi:hypothetical protein